MDLSFIIFIADDPVDFKSSARDSSSTGPSKSKTKDEREEKKKKKLTLRGLQR